MSRVYHGSPGHPPPGIKVPNGASRTAAVVRDWRREQRNRAPAAAVAAAVLLLASRARPGWRRPAAIACWVLLPTAIGWFVLAGRLI
jgi:hypothetical protein